MYKVIDIKTGDTMAELVYPTWVRQQRLVDRPILARSLEEADGVVLPDGETMVGIAGRGMDNYKPLVTIEEVSGEPVLMANIEQVQRELSTKADQLSSDELKELVLANMQGMADLYTEQENTQALQLDTMQGLADLYALQTEGGV